MLTPCLLANGTTRMRANLDGPPVRAGQAVTLKGIADADGLVMWTIIEASPPLNPRYVHRGWNNNI